MDTVSEFTHEAKQFYSRHLMLPGFGTEAQGRLADATVAVVGLGGIGCPAVAQLAAAGVGVLRLIDPDFVDISNILRQGLYFSEDIGVPKAMVAADQACKINGSIFATGIAKAFEPSLIEGCSIVLDCTDNIAAREQIARAAFQADIPMVHGAAIGYEGRVATFEGSGSPCLGCLLAESAPEETCGEAGVFAPVTAVVGSLMAGEAIKRISCFGKSSVGLTVYDGLAGEFHHFDVRPDPDCRICGDQPSTGVPCISVADLAKKLRSGEEILLLDVREAHELEISRIDPCVHIPMSEVLWKSEALPRAADICVLCRTGNRSGTITQALRLRGFTNVRNVAGGINAYAEQIDPRLQTY